MKLSKLTLAITAAMSAGISCQALALNLYVDTKTKQLFAEPGPHRQLLGEFEKIEGNERTSNAPAQKVQKSSALDKEEIKKLNEEVVTDKAEIETIKNDLELKANELKALEEHVVANREDKAKNDEKWFNKINLRGYTQLRYNQGLSGDRVNSDPELRSVGDGGIKDNGNFSFRRVRLVFSGDINDYLYLYVQPDFASNVSDSQQNFAQLRDAYADLAIDKKHEYRIRAGQSKVPFGWENLQSSQNRLTLDRADALNSAVPSERDLGLFAYWTPEDVQKLWKNLSKKGLKTSGDYGVLGAGVYNGQGLNRAETNDDIYVVAHSTYPFSLNFLGKYFKDQVLEVGADAMTGYFNPTTADSARFGTKTGLLKTSLDKTIPKGGIREDRVALHAILFPQPFGFQAEWNWGQSAALNADGANGTGTIERRGLNGGYLQAMYKIDNVFREDGVLIPYVKWQTYRGAWKGATNQPYTYVDEIEAGVEYQIMKAIEVTLAYSSMDRTNTTSGSNFLGRASGDLLRAQLQWNY